MAYLADRSPQAALSTLGRLEARAKSLATFAERRRIVPELARWHITDYRELVAPPHRVVYRVDGSRVLVLAVVDSRRSLEDILLDRLLRVESADY